jgi:hypothetical protein
MFLLRFPVLAVLSARPVLLNESIAKFQVVLSFVLACEFTVNAGYDLLDENRDDSRRLEDLPQVRVRACTAPSFR